MFLACPASTISSSACQVSWIGVSSVSENVLSSCGNSKVKQPVRLTKLNGLSIVTEPLRGVALCGIDVLERNGEVDKEKVKVVETPVRELLLR